MELDRDSDGMDTQPAALPPALVCHAAGRWEDLARTQHLLTRLASHRAVFFIEAPVADEDGPRLSGRTAEGGVVVVTPLVSAESLERPPVRRAVMRQLLDRLIVSADIEEHIAWYDSPLAFAESEHLDPRLVVYDCVEDAGRGRAGPADLAAREDDLLMRADLVFTGGQGLYEARCARHPSVFCLPSAIDVALFRQARTLLPVPSDQRAIPGPRLGYAGVIDDRLDVDLVAGLAAARPDCQIVLLGPVLTRDPSRLPRASNIHYLGPKAIEELPAYLAGWDVALLPLVRGDATRALGPGRTLEYLAAGLPVVATPLRDVRPYAREGLVEVADGLAALDGAVAAALSARRHPQARAAKAKHVDRMLAAGSWDETARRIAELLAEQMRVHAGARGPRRAAI